MSTIATTNIKEPSSATNNITLTSGGDTTISGNATVTGTLTFPPNAGQVLQVVNFQTGEYNSGTTVIPTDDTIPQNTEGTEFMTLAITPTSATSKLLIEVSALLGTSIVNSWVVGALFQDTTADALAAVVDWEEVNNAFNEVTLRHYMTAGTTSTTTFKFRAGIHAAGTVYFNGNNTGRYLGGVAASSITITEIAT
jgi:hypothetical protein